VAAPARIARPTGPGAPGRRRDRSAGDHLGARVLPAFYCGHAVLEVPAAEDFQMVRTPADIEITWLARGSRPHGELLSDMVHSIMAGSSPVTAGPEGRTLREVDIDAEILWETPEPAQTGDAAFYAWIAGEAATVRDLRRYLVRELGVDKKASPSWATGGRVGPRPPDRRPALCDRDRRDGQARTAQRARHVGSRSRGRRRRRHPPARQDRHHHPGSPASTKCSPRPRLRTSSP